MKKTFASFKTLTVFILLSANMVANAQPNTWTLVNGSDNVTNINPVYGAKGQPSATNTPGSRDNFVTWVDANNNLWLFGGFNSYPFNYFADLWKFNTTSNEWTWVSGDSTSNSSGHYGVKGQPSDSTFPQARVGASSWRDNLGNLWLFGGNNYGYENDLWKYNISANQWTWMGGDSSSNDYGYDGVYGAIGVGSTSNIPGSRAYSTCWTDQSGLFWIFGGWGFVSNGPSGTETLLNDLWQYDPSNNEWTCVNAGQSPSYGVKGKPSLANAPVSREVSPGWVDKSNNLWLFGGENNIISPQLYYFDDLCKYNIAANEWTWINGSDTVNKNGSYGTQGTPDTANTPGGRFSSTAWTDANGDFWLFGGAGNGATGSQSGFLNDLWKYTVSANAWTWVSGDTSINPTTTNAVPAPREAAGYWTDNNGVFWLYGGANNNGYLESLWKYTPSDTIASVTATINPVASSFLTVYPNPGNGNFTVDLPEAAQVSVYSILGDLIVTENLPKGKQPLSLTNKPAGVYYLKATSSSGQQTVKLVVE